MTKDEALIVIATLTGAYPGVPFGEDNAEVFYRSVLATIPFDVGIEAARRIVTKETRMPSAARFNEEVRIIRGPQEHAALPPAPDATAPSCPQCGCSPKERNANNEPFLERLGEAIAGRRFHCRRCNCIYVGTIEEWEKRRNREHRETWAEFGSHTVQVTS